ncbi:DinB family protein [Marmoricola sp. RAF53]|uniref:DinB family protein n=1 Tax=Marmoricola sp. RAF53 TaxID=3233059 RepID=UPI003F99E5AF
MEPPLIADERTQLDGFLDAAREEIVAGLAGLTEEQARRRLVPSLTTPIGLVKHATFVEQVWFHVAMAGRTRSELGLPDEIDDTFAFDDSDTVDGVIAEYRRVCAEAREIAAGFALDDLAQYNRRSPLTVRWVYVHLVRELSAHAGHADILREQILASDG